MRKLLTLIACVGILFSCEFNGNWQEDVYYVDKE